MKKFRTLLFMMLALAMVFSLASCDIASGSGNSSDEITTEAPAPEKTYTADELFDIIDEKMDSYNSYESTLEMVLNMTINGVEVKTTSKGVEIVVGSDFYTEMETVVSSPSLSSSQKVTSIEAYYGGNYFISNRGKGADQKFYSPMTKEEAEEYADDSDTDFFEFNDCVNKEVKKNDDGTYELIFSGYTAKTVNEIMDETGIDTSMLTHDIVDVTFHIKADAEFNATALEFAFVFEQKPGGETMPEFNMKGTFSKFNEAEIKTSTINPDKYTKVDDIRMLEDITELLVERWEADEGSFTLDISQTLKIMGDTQQSSETDTVVFGSNADGYFYDIAADMSGTKYDISYSKGIQTVAVDGQTQQGAQTEAEARAFVTSLMNSSQFDGVSVTDMKKLSDTQYSFTCEPKDTYKALIEQMGATFRSVTQTIVITVENGAVTRIESEAKATGAVTQGNNTFQLSFTVVSDVIFDK